MANNKMVIERQLCTGCTACMNICPVNAIQMKENEEGFAYPYIDETVCIKCNRCTNTCPAIKGNNNDTQYQQKIYGAINRDETVRHESSSGGVFYVLGKAVIDAEGVVYGAVFDEKGVVYHTRISDLTQLKKAIGSKYVQSKMNHCLTEAKNDLENGKQVLFAGTPCQIDGLMCFLGKNYDNLLTVDLVCHGVPSPMIWEQYICEMQNEYNSSIKKVNFRSKEMAGWVDFNIELQFENGKVYKASHDKDKYFCLFLENYILREPCYECKYRQYERVADITLGDFWGIDAIKSKLSDGKGTSMVLVNSKKGERAFKQVEMQMTYEIHTREECMQSAIRKRIRKPKNVDAFWNEYSAKGFHKALNKFGKKSWYRKCVTLFLPFVRKTGLYNILVKMK